MNKNYNTQLLFEEAKANGVHLVELMFTDNILLSILSCNAIVFTLWQNVNDKLQYSNVIICALFQTKIIKSFFATLNSLLKTTRS